MFRSINPRLRESAHIPDLTWNSFLAGGAKVSGEAALTFPLLPWFEELWLDTAGKGSVWEVKTPKGSEPSKLFIGTLANGSEMLLDSSDFEALLPIWGAGSGAAKKSIVAETGGVGAGWEANRSTSNCRKAQNMISYGKVLSISKIF